MECQHRLEMCLYGWVFSTGFCHCNKNMLCWSQKMRDSLNSLEPRASSNLDRLISNLITDCERETNSCHCKRLPHLSLTPPSQDLSLFFTCSTAHSHCCRTGTSGSQLRPPTVLFAYSFSSALKLALLSPVIK